LIDIFDAACEFQQGKNVTKIYESICSVLSKNIILQYLILVLKYWFR